MNIKLLVKSYILFFVCNIVILCGLIAFALWFGPSAYYCIPGFILFQVIAIIFSPALKDFRLQQFFQVQWLVATELEKVHAQFFKKIFDEQSLPLPQIGFIENSLPTLFSYGNTPKTTRLIFSRGLLELLSQEEVSALIYRECSHIKSYNYILMAMAQFISDAFWFVTDILNFDSDTSKEKNEKKNYIQNVCEVITVVAHFAILIFTKMREKIADQYAVEQLKSGIPLASALIKFGYGAFSGSKRVGPQEALMPTGPLLSLPSKRFVSENSQALIPSHLLDWERVNPWAKIYEFFSSHRRISTRLELISKAAQKYGESIILEKPRKKLNNILFLKDILWIIFVPILLIFAFIFAYQLQPDEFMTREANCGFVVIVAVLVIGLFIYRKLYPNLSFDEKLSTVVNLLGEVDVSYFSPFPTHLTGKIIGRESDVRKLDPHLYFKDETGVITLRIKEAQAAFLLSKNKDDSLVGEAVEVFGLFRREPFPVIDVRRINGKELNTPAKAYLTFAVMALIIVVIYLGLVWFPKFYTSHSELKPQADLQTIFDESQIEETSLEKQKVDINVKINQCISDNISLEKSISPKSEIDDVIKKYCEQLIKKNITDSVFEKNRIRKIKLLFATWFEEYLKLHAKKIDSELELKTYSTLEELKISNNCKKSLPALREWARQKAIRVLSAKAYCEWEMCQKNKNLDCPSAIQDSKTLSQFGDGEGYAHLAYFYKEQHQEDLAEIAQQKAYELGAITNSDDLLTIKWNRYRALKYLVDVYSAPNFYDAELIPSTSLAPYHCARVVVTEDWIFQKKRFDPAALSAKDWKMRVTDWSDSRSPEYNPKLALRFACEIISDQQSKIKFMLNYSRLSFEPLNFCKVIKDNDFSSACED